MSAAVTLPAPPSILDLAHGLHEGIPEAVYHQRIPGVASKHVLDLVADTPAHYQAWLKGAVEDDSEALRFGRLLHCAVLEPERFLRDFLPRPGFGDCRKKENKVARDAWLADHGCPSDAVADPDLREVWLAANTVDVDDMATIRGMAQSVATHPDVLGHLYRGKKELTAVAELEGVAVKARADLFDEREGVILDLKSCRKASPEEFAKSAHNLRYHVQDRLYVRLWELFAELHRRPFRFVAVEKTPPYAVAVYSLTARAQDKGDELVKRDLERFARCVEEDVWPGYPTGVHELDLPPWAYR